VQDIGRDGEITNIERVHLVPALGSKFASLASHRMEIAEGEEDRLKLRLLGASFQSVLGKIVPCLVQIGGHSGWRFIDHL